MYAIDVMEDDSRDATYNTYVVDYINNVQIDRQLWRVETLMNLANLNKFAKA